MKYVHIEKYAQKVVWDLARGSFEKDLRNWWKKVRFYTSRASDLTKAVAIPKEDCKKVHVNTSICTNCKFVHTSI